MSSTPADAARRRFRLRPWLTLCTLAGLALLVSLGTWQLQRLAWKRGLIAAVEARLAQPASELPAGRDLAGADYGRYVVRGHYVHAAAQAYGIQGEGGQPGARLLTPFVLEDGRVILVDRGWLPEALLPPHVPLGLQPEGEAVLVGVVRWRADTTRGWLTPKDEPERRRWFGWDIPAMAQATGRPLLPLVLTLDHSEGPAGLPKPAPVTAEFRNDHLGYAITWYGLAGGLLVVYLLFSFSQDEARHP